MRIPRLALNSVNFPICGALWFINQADFLVAGRRQAIFGFVSGSQFVTGETQRVLQKSWIKIKSLIKTERGNSMAGPQQPYPQQGHYNPPPGKKGMSTGTIIAIVFGVLFLIALLIVGLLALMLFPAVAQVRSAAKRVALSLIHI